MSESDNSSSFTYDTDIIKDDLIDRINTLNRNTRDNEITSLFIDIISFVYVDDNIDNTLQVGNIDNEGMLFNYFNQIIENLNQNKKINKEYYLNLFKGTEYYNDLNSSDFGQEGKNTLKAIEGRISYIIDTLNSSRLMSENLPQTQFLIDNDGNRIEIPITEFEKMNISERNELYKNDRNKYNSLFNDMIQNRINHNAAHVTVNNNGSISSITRTDAIKTNQNTPITSPEKNDLTYEDMIHIHYPASEPANKKRKLGGKTNRKNKPNKRKTKKQFLFNPNNPKKSFDVYIDKNPNDTIPIKYTTVEDVKKTIKKLENLYKQNKYPHKRIWQVGMILKVRLEAMKKHKKKLYPNAKNVTKRYNLSKKYFKFLKKRTHENNNKTRKKMTFRY